MFNSLAFISAFLLLGISAETHKMKIKMPGVVTKVDDTYLCAHLHVNETKFIIGFEPDADMHVAHHMLLFKCRHPVITSAASYRCSFSCVGGKVIYAWARQASGLHLPRDVAFEVGGDSGYPYLTLQVHYLKARKTPDFSGVTMTMVQRPTPRVAGVMLMASNDGAIPGGERKVTLHFACKYSSRTSIRPFAFRTHAHTLGRTIFAFRFPRHRQAWPLMLGRASPQWPQAFYNASSTGAVHRGDLIIGACVYDSSHRQRTTTIGATHHDEMCNFYLMYSRHRDDSEPSRDSLDACGDGVQLSRPLFERLQARLPQSVYEYLPTSLAEQRRAEAQAKAETKAAEFRPLPDWTVQYPRLGQVSGVTTDQRGRLLVFHRGDRVWDQHTFLANHRLANTSAGPIRAPTLLVVEAASGRVLEAHGADLFYLPHGVSVDAAGGVWLTDVGLHQVVHFRAGEWTRPALRIGTALEPGSGPHHLCQPAAVAVLPSGEVLVADGYCNSRVARFSPSGRFLGAWTSAHGSFQVPHSLTLVSPSLACVADRERARIECFRTASGRSALTLRSPALGSAVYAIAAEGRLLHGVAWGAGRRRGFSLDLDGRVHARWGAGLRRPHDLALLPGAAFVADLAMPPRVYKFERPAPVPPGPASGNASGPVSAPAALLAANGSADSAAEGGAAERKAGFLELLSRNAPFLIGVVIAAPLATVALGAALARVHRAGLCPCVCCRPRVRLRTDADRGRFAPLLNEDSDDETAVMDRIPRKFPKS